MSLLSIIVPVYNVEYYLEKCVNSILNQTFSDFELLLIDDGSTDNSGKMCDEFALRDKRIKVFHLSNGGQSVARNKGIDYALGNYISFIDSDDWLDKDMYSCMVAPLLKGEDFDIMVCGHRVLTEFGEIEEEVVFPKTISMSGIEATNLILEDEKLPSFPWNKIYKKELFKNIRFPSGRVYEDTATIYKVFHLSKRVYIVSSICYNYLRRKESTCLDTNPLKVARRSYDNFRAFYERYLFAKEHIEYTSVLKTCAQKAFMLGINLIHFMIKEQSLYESFDKLFVYNSIRKMDNIMGNRKIPAKKKVEYLLLKLNPSFYNLIVRLFYRLHVI